jgi:hypothetical protein
VIEIENFRDSHIMLIDTNSLKGICMENAITGHRNLNHIWVEHKDFISYCIRHRKCALRIKPQRRMAGVAGYVKSIIPSIRSLY